MAHKCGLPYTIPRSHTIHHPSDLPRRSVDHLPLTQSAFAQEPLSLSMEPLPQSQQTSQHGSPNSVPSAGTDDIATTSSLEQAFLDSFATPTFPSTAPMDASIDGTSNNPTSAPTTMDKFPLEQIITSVPRLSTSRLSPPLRLRPTTPRLPAWPSRIPIMIRTLPPLTRMCLLVLLVRVRPRSTGPVSRCTRMSLLPPVRKLHPTPASTTRIPRAFLPLRHRVTSPRSTSLDHCRASHTRATTCTICTA